MTLREISSQLHSLSVDGFFNRQKVTVRWLESYISTMLLRAGGDSLVMEIALPDGWWHFTIHKFADGDKIGFDYVIPDTRKQEAHILSDLWDRYNQVSRK